MNLKSRLKKLESNQSVFSKKTNSKTIVYVFITYEEGKRYLYSTDNLGHGNLYNSVEELSLGEKIPLNAIEVFDRGGIYLPPEAEGIAIKGVRIK